MRKYFILILAVYFICCSCNANKAKSNMNHNKEESETTTILDHDVNQEYRDNEENEITAILSRLEYIEDEKVLLIKSLADLDFIKNIPQGVLSEYVEWLSIYLFRNWNLDLTFIEQFSQLKRLNISGQNNRNNIEKFESVRYLNNLEYLSLDNINVSDISPIADLGNLTDLTLFQINQLNDISPIANLRNLTHLTLGQLNQIHDISFLNKLINLKTLVISHLENIEGTHTILELKNLEALGLYIISQDKYIISQDFLNGIVNLEKLRELRIPMSAINDLSPLLGLPNLVYIGFGNFSYDKMPLIMPLATSNSLKKIYIGFGTSENSRYFWNNGGEIFTQNGIEIDEPHDYR